MKYNHSPRLIIILAACSLFIFGCYQGARKTASRNSPSSATSMSSFLFLSDVHLDVNLDTTCMGDDAGMDLWNKCEQKLKTIISGPNPPKFILYTGDLPVHYWCKNCGNSCPISKCDPATIAQHYQGIKTMLAKLGGLASAAHIPLLYVPGNNDALEGDYYPFSGKDYPTPFSLVNEDSSSGYPYRLFGVNKPAGHKNPYVISDQHVPSGYWSVRVMDGLRVICLNTVIWGTEIKNILANDTLMTMAKQEMDWLKDQLLAAAQSGDKVFMAMHIPPGMDAYAKKPMWNSWQSYALQDSFLTLLQQFNTTITGVFYGHTHYDELRLLYTNKGKTMAKVALSCPGISANHQNDPAFKLVQFDQNKMLPMDFTTYLSPLDCNKPTNTWGDYSYKFSELFCSGPGVSIYDRLAHMDTAEVQKRMQFTYKAGNGISDAGSSGVIVK